MKLFVNNENKRFIGAAAAVLLLYAILGEALIWVYCKKLSVVFFILFLLPYNICSLLTLAEQNHKKCAPSD